MPILKSLFSVKNNDESELDTYHEIVCGASMRGTNSWLMVFAMLVACIGLNIDSKAAVIGAMIASPLMGPVFGVSFALATRHYTLLKFSFNNLFWVVMICLLSSTVYYLLTPFQDSTNELVSFAHPSIFDIILAVLGGILGMLAISRRDGNRVLVGVAVATACIPPLCTAGFGLAHLDWEFFWGGLYMYAINSLFIGISAYFTALYLGFSQISQQHQIPGLRYVFGILSIILLVYAGYITFEMSQNQRFENQAKAFVASEIEAKYFVMKQKIYSPTDSTHVIEVAIVDNNIPTDLESRLNQKIKLKNTRLILHRITQK